MRALLVLLAIAGIVALSACSGDDDAPTRSPTPSLYKPTPETFAPSPSGGKPTPNPAETLAPTPSPIPAVTAPPGLRTCSIDDVYGAFVADVGGDAGSVGYSFGFSNTNSTSCALPGPPSLVFLDADSHDTSLQYSVNGACGTSAPPCVVNGRIELPAGVPTPGSRSPASGQAGILVMVGDTHNFPTCNSPEVFARFVAVAFPGMTGEITMRLPRDWELETCRTQIELYSFGGSQ